MIKFNLHRPETTIVFLPQHILALLPKFLEVQIFNAKNPPVAILMGMGTAAGVSFVLQDIIAMAK